MYNRAVLAKIIAFLVIIAGSTSGIQAQGSPAPFNDTIKERVILEIDQSIRKNFAHWQGVGPLNYDQAFADYRKAALATPDRQSFSLLTKAFVARLNNGHTQFNDTFLFQSDPGNLGLALRYQEPDWIVMRSRRPDIPAGSIVSKIDGKSFESFFQQAKAMLSASNDRTRRTTFSSYPFLFPLAFSLELGDGSVVAIDRAKPMTAPAKPAVPVVSHRWLVPGQVGYIRISSFDGAAYESEARTAIDGNYAQAKALVIDLRGNGGGNTPSRLGRDLLGPDWVRWKSTGPPAPVQAKQRAVPQAPRYVLIIDRGCGSACEDFAMPFSISTRAILVGETTAGSTGQPKFTDWGNGMMLWVGSRRQWFPDGREFEGVGITPDIAITLTASDFSDDAPDIMLICAQAIIDGNGSSRCRR